MFAIVEIGGHQHHIKKDQIFLSELVGSDVDKEIECKNVLMVGSGKDVKSGAPYVDGASVKLKVIERLAAPKINGFTYRRRSGTKKTWGHRQKLHRLQVIEINS